MSLLDDYRKHYGEPTPGRKASLNFIDASLKESGDGMKDFRCSKCKKLLGRVEGKAQIKCPRCGELNESWIDKYVNKGVTAVSAMMMFEEAKHKGESRDGHIQKQENAPR